VCIAGSFTFENAWKRWNHESEAREGSTRKQQEKKGTKSKKGSKKTGSEAITDGLFLTNVSIPQRSAAQS